MKASIIVPTFKEADNLAPLTERLFKTLETSKRYKPSDVELLIIDDNSKDGSEEKVNRLAKRYPVRIIVRTQERGLSSAVIRGFQEATGDVLICMDADLQHPPEKVPELLDALQSFEFVIGTRYATGSSHDKDWPLYRHVISTAARLMARPLTPLSDPMTGFFGLQRNVFARCVTKLNPIGFKIAMECYVKGDVQTLQEVPISFGVRLAGESKLSGKVIVSYLRHLLELYWFKYPAFIIAAIVLVVYALLFY